MFKSFLKFTLIVIVSQIITYFFAGIIAQVVLGASEFYPPSPNAISYLKDPHDPTVMAWLLPTQALRGLLFAFVLFPFRQRILELGTRYGGLAIAGIIFIVGYVAASGGMIEHFLYFKAAGLPSQVRGDYVHRSSDSNSAHGTNHRTFRQEVHRRHDQATVAESTTPILFLENRSAYGE